MAVATSLHVVSAHQREFQGCRGNRTTPLRERAGTTTLRLARESDAFHLLARAFIAAIIVDRSCYQALYVPKKFNLEANSP